MLRLSSINVTGTSYLGNLIISADNVSINNLMSVNSTPTFSGNITFGNYSDEFMRITGQGKVGIGTTSPTHTLTIVGGGINVSDNINNYFGGLRLNGLDTPGGKNVIWQSNSGNGFGI